MTLYEKWSFPLIVKGRFYNYVALKLPFFTLLSPTTITFSRLFTRNLLHYVTLSTNIPLPSQYKTKFLDLKRIGVEVKKSLSSFICFFFQLSTNNTKKVRCLKSKTCHYCHSLDQTGSIPSKAGVHTCNLFFKYRKILYWFFFYPDFKDFNQVPHTP